MVLIVLRNGRIAGGVEEVNEKERSRAWVAGLPVVLGSCISTPAEAYVTLQTTSKRVISIGMRIFTHSSTLHILWRDARSKAHERCSCTPPLGHHLPSLLTEPIREPCTSSHAASQAGPSSHSLCAAHFVRGLRLGFRLDAPLARSRERHQSDVVETSDPFERLVGARCLAAPKPRPDRARRKATQSAFDRGWAMSVSHVRPRYGRELPLLQHG